LPGKFVSQGRQGVHSEHLAYLLAEMQVLHRSHPGAQW
jgi:ring-1,2-phenylacetyl-CoA epoxidase subunit PaaC